MQAELIYKFLFFSFLCSTDHGGNEDFFEKFSSIRISYENSEKKRIQEFKFQPDDVDGQITDQLWPTLGGWNVSQLFTSFWVSHHKLILRHITH